MLERNFRVVIVGGSVAGLTLAHGLDRIGLDYVVLEKWQHIAPQEGASVGIMPNVARVLDQLGLYDAVEQAMAPFGITRIVFPDKYCFTSAYPKRMFDNFGYPIAFLERRELLRILYDALPDKSKVHVGEQMTDIEQDESGVGVRTATGALYHGDLVVGADGVHSKVRSEMWRLSRAAGQAEKSANTRDMSVDYSCCFGISTKVSGLGAGKQIMRVYKGCTLVVISSKNGVVFWFLVEKLKRRFSYDDAPRFTKDQAAEHCLRLADADVGGIRFGDVLAKGTALNMVPMEEHVFQQWSFGRIVCIGDSMHKMTVNLGQGANCAIEDVAVLCNLLRDCVGSSKGTTKKPSFDEINALLRRFNREHLPRVRDLYNMSWTLTRIHAQAGFKERLLSRYVKPLAGNLLERRPMCMIAGAAALDFVPLPRAEFEGWKRYAPRAGGMSSWGMSKILLVVLIGGVWFYRLWMGRMGIF